MFRNPFSFDGRIRRTEYGISFILFVIVGAIVKAIVVAVIMGSGYNSGYSSDNYSSGQLLTFLFYIPLLWFLWAQGSKRCHDADMSGWWQLIPFMPLVLIFIDGTKGNNRYGEDPKGTNIKSKNTTSNSIGGYQGNPYGSNTLPVSNPGTTQSQTTRHSDDGYNGTLY